MGETGSEVMFLEPNEELGGRLISTIDLKVKRKKATV